MATLTVPQKTKLIETYIEEGEAKKFFDVWKSCEPKTKKSIAEKLIHKACQGKNAKIAHTFLQEKPEHILTLLKEKNYSLVRSFFENSFGYFLWQKHAQHIFNRLITDLHNELSFNNSLLKELYLFLILANKMQASLKAVTIRLPNDITGNKIMTLIVQFLSQEKLKENFHVTNAADENNISLVVSFRQGKITTPISPPGTPVTPIGAAARFTYDALPEPAANPAPHAEKISAQDLLNLFRLNQLDKIQHHLKQIEDQGQALEADNSVLAALARLISDESIRNTWTIKDGNKIDMVLADRDQTLQESYQRDRRKYDLALKAFQLLNPIVYQQLSGDQKIPTKEALEAFYQNEAKAQKRYPAYDPSDDSDSEDEKAIKTAATARGKRLAMMRAQHKKPHFWRRTRRSDTGGKGSLQAKGEELIGEAVTIITTSQLQKLIDKTLKGSGYLQDRATITHLAKQGKPLVVVCRGANYLGDRWDNENKREHYAQDETGKTQYAEAALMAERNIYSRDSLQQPAAKAPLSCAETAQKIQQTMKAFSETGPCVAHTIKPRRAPYVFNSFADYLQHCYSNGISQHLLAITELLQSKNDWLKDKFVGAYNYGLSNG